MNILILFIIIIYNKNYIIYKINLIIQIFRKNYFLKLKLEKM